MRLLEYLFPSRARRQLLKVLRSRQSGQTLLQLSKEAGVAYSNAHREVGQMTRLGLVRTKRVGNALLCSWNSGSPSAKALAPLLQESRVGAANDPGDDTVFWNLRQWGAPLARAGSEGTELSLESTLGYALALARRHPEVARVWPVVFAKHRPAVDLRALARLAGRLGQKKTLGFFLALTRTLLKDQSLLGAERALRDGRFKKTHDFFLSEGSERARALADLRTPAVAREWRFRMNMPLESFATSFEKFTRRHEELR